MASNISKIERVHAPQNGKISVELKLDKEKGIFFADVGVRRVTAETKSDAVKQIREALGKIEQTEWRPVILIRIDTKRRRADKTASYQNGMALYSSTCSFDYCRRERAPNLLKPKEILERDHVEDFELKVTKARKEVQDWGGWDAKNKKSRADAKEAEMREERARCGGAHQKWNWENEEEQELPYSPEAWAGIQRIAEALRETQARLDAFVREATPEKLKALGTGSGVEVLRALPAAAPMKTARKKNDNE